MNKNKGFTLIEILLYTVIFAIVGGLMTGILLTVTQVQQRESAGAEVTGQLNLVMQTINRLVRESSNIEIEAGTTVSTLKLRMKDTAKDPTCISLVSGVIKLAEGPGTNPNNCKSETSDLTSDRVIVNTFNFKKFTQYPGHDTVSIDLVMTYNSTNPKSQVQRTLSSAIARVSAATFDSDVVPGGTYNFNLGQAGAPWQKVIMADGTASNPSYTFGSNTGLGLFAASSTTILGFSTAGTERMRIDASGNVGIGTTAPSGLLHVVDPDFTDTALFERSGATTNEVYGAARILATKTSDMGDGFGSALNFVIRDNAAVINNLASVGASRDGTDTSGKLEFGTNNAGSFGTKMVVDKNGNVGIGTSTPTTAKLVVNGTISASAPTADSHVATKAYVDAAAGAKTWYRTSTTANGANADTLCAAGYHMCYPNEWLGRTWDSTLGDATDSWIMNAWVDLHSGNSSIYTGDCNNWTDQVTSGGGAIVVYAVGIGEYMGSGVEFLTATCSGVYAALCCKD